MALGRDRGQTGHLDPLASKGIQSVLEVEVSVARSAESANRSPKIDRPHGVEQSDMGRGTDRERAFAKDWNSDFATHGSPLYAARAGATQGPFSALDDLRSQSCQSHHRR